MPPLPFLNGTYYGALYMQAVLPWACAVRAAVATNTLCDTVRRVGHAMVRRYEVGGQKEKFRLNAMENMHTEYMGLTHISVWGSQDDDIVWQTFVVPDMPPNK